MVVIPKQDRSCMFDDEAEMGEIDYDWLSGFMGAKEGKIIRMWAMGQVHPFLSVPSVAKNLGSKPNSTCFRRNLTSPASQSAEIQVQCQATLLSLLSVFWQ